MRSYIVILHILLALGLVFLGPMLIGAAPARPWSKLPFLSFPALMKTEPLSVGDFLNNQHSVDHKKFSKFSGPPTELNTRAWEDLIQRI